MNALEEAYRQPRTFLEAIAAVRARSTDRMWRETARKTDRFMVRWEVRRARKKKDRQGNIQEAGRVNRVR